MKRGYTFVEVAVFVAILGILAGLVAPAFIAYRAKSKRAREAQLGQTAPESPKPQNPNWWEEGGK